MTTSLQIKSNLSIDDLIDDLSQLDAPTLQYLIHELQGVQLAKTQEQQKVEQTFWGLIEQIDWSKSKEEERLRPMLETLKNFPISAIHRFSEQLAKFLHQLDGPAYYEALKSRQEGVSADTFSYARCLVVARGKSFFEKVMQQPKEMPIAEDFEALLYVANEAYQQKTGEAYDFVPSVPYESFFNQELWKEKAITL